jgi:hypothetical protein
MAVVQLQQDETRLVRVIELLRSRLLDLGPSPDPVDCIAEGRLVTAIEAVQAAANLLGED